MNPMRHLSRRAAAATLVVGLVTAAAAVPALASVRAAGPSAPSAASNSGGATTATPAKHQKGGAGIRKRAVRALVKAVADATGQTPKEVVAQLRAGKTLSEIAGDKAGAIETAALATLHTKLDKAVANKRITAAQETTMLGKAPALIHTLMTTKLKQHAAPATT